MPQTPGRPVAAPAQVDANIATLRAQMAELNIQLRALRATSRGLVRQLEGMRLDNPARPALQQQSADVGAQIAQVEGKIAEVQARLAQAQNVSVDRITETGTLAPPPLPPFARRGPDPDMVVGMSFALAMCIALPLSIAYARRLWKGKPPEPQQPLADRFDDVVQRLNRLELGIDSMAVEIERISEGQRFVTKVFADRQQPQSASPDVARQSALGEGQQPLRALGAGAVEPIRVNNADAVKERAKG